MWILMKQEMMGWQWHQLDHMQITCTSLQTDNHATISSIFTGQMLFLMPNQECQSTEGKVKYLNLELRPTLVLDLLWPPYVIVQAIYIFILWFLSIYLSSFFSSPNLSGHRLDLYHTSTHGVARVRI